MLTPQTNCTIDEIAERFLALDDFVICGHVNPDGDCLGSQLALAHALRALGKSVTLVRAKPDPIPANLRFMPGVEKIHPASHESTRHRVFVGVDVPTLGRIEDAARLHERAEVRFTIDHHACETTMADFVYVDPDAPAASLIVWNLIKLLGEPSCESAVCALTGLITDTGRFSYQNTTPEAFIAAAEMVTCGASPALINREFFQSRTLPSLLLEGILLDNMKVIEDGQFSYSVLTQADFDACNAVKSDSEPLIDTLRSVEGVKVALLLKENGKGEVRGSLRAKDDETDVAQVARKFDGGGHKAAAGFTYKGTLDEALVEVINAVRVMCLDPNEDGVAHG